jgi:hypothetical protein
MLSHVCRYICSPEIQMTKLEKFSSKTYVLKNQKNFGFEWLGTNSFIFSTMYLKAKLLHFGFSLKRLLYNNAMQRRDRTYIAPGWPDWANFRLLEDCFIREVFFHYRRSQLSRVTRFLGESNVYVDKNGLGCTLGDFLANSSGHPAKRLKLIWIDPFSQWFRLVVCCNDRSLWGEREKYVMAQKMFWTGNKISFKLWKYIT